jgi:hypothetical protein
MDWAGTRLMWMWWWTYMFHDIFSAKHSSGHFIPPGILIKCLIQHTSGSVCLICFLYIHVFKNSQRKSVFCPHWSGPLQKHTCSYSVSAFICYYFFLKIYLVAPSCSVLASSLKHTVLWEMWLRFFKQCWYTCMAYMHTCLELLYYTRIVSFLLILFNSDEIPLCPI